MPFPDEVAPVRISTYDSRWPREFASLAAALTTTLTPLVRAVDHVGSTAVPGLCAKDVLDVQLRVVDEDAFASVGRRLAADGYRERPEPWNRTEEAAGRTWPKRVFAPGPGARAVNVHVRSLGSPPARRALLFRDYLRAHPGQRQAWGELKQHLAGVLPDAQAYGTAKSAAWAVLMNAAEDWAENAGWAVDGS